MLPTTVLLTCALTGCGVDSTRALWSHAWVPPTPPAHGRLVWHSERTLAFGAKGVITPGAVTVDVLTDKRVWEGVAVVVTVVVVAAAVGCLTGGHGGCGNVCPDFHFSGGGAGGSGTRAAPCSPYDGDEATPYHRTTSPEL
jgi:hypothetical protein